MVDQNFIAIKLGDVDNSCSPAFKAEATGELILLMDKYHAISTDRLTIPIKAKHFNNITGCQFTLSWDASELTLLEVTNKALQGYYREYRKG